MLKKLKIFLISFLAVFMLAASPALAKTNSDNGTPLAVCKKGPNDSSKDCKQAIQQTCPSGKAKWQDVGNKSYVVCASAFGNDTGSNNPIWSDLKDIVNALGAGVGVIVVTMIVIGGIQYTIAGDQPGKVEEAKKKIANALFALVAFLLTWGLLNWLIPTGIFHPH